MIYSLENPLNLQNCTFQLCFALSIFSWLLVSLSLCLSLALLRFDDLRPVKWDDQVDFRLSKVLVSGQFCFSIGFLSKSILQK